MSRLTRWVALAAAIAAVASLAVGIMTPPRSGPNCLSECVGYPYTDAASFVPRDYLWMYPSTLAALLAVWLGACVFAEVPAHRRGLALAGVGFAAIGSGVLVVDYGIQLTVLQPSLLNAETGDLSLWSQYNPHGIFIALENVGYVTLSLALLLLGLALWTSPAWAAARSRPVRLAAWVFAVAGITSLILTVVLGAAYGARLEYRLEVFSLLITWLALIGGGLALSAARRPVAAHD
jgi:hypothetical protein